MAKRPEVYDKIWVSSLDDRTRPSHRAAHGQRVPFSESFTVGGELLDFPGDPSGSPGEVNNCRCYIRIEQHSKLVLLGAAGGNDMAPKPSDVAQKLKDAAAAVLTIDEDREELADDGDGGETEAETFQTFTAVVAVLGKETSDRRILDKNIELTFRELPLPWMWMEQSQMYGHGRRHRGSQDLRGRGPGQRLLPQLR
jgi:hypothetical protein